ncbi:MAG: GNAT family N-acetyltransferase [Phycisphaerales bacterium]|nr:GNAT family N-acetyltransferase [Phycisphaerales bacterium]
MLKVADWREQWKAKIKTAAQALRAIRPGDHIYLSDGSSTPLGLVQSMCGDDIPLGDNEVIHLMTLGAAPYTDPKFAGRVRHNALFIGANVRDAIAEGRADYTPVFLSEIPALIESRRIPVDIALVSVSEPNAHGFCSLGTHVSLSPAAIAASRMVVAEVNPRMPRTNGPYRLHVDQIDALVEISHELPEAAQHKDKPETGAIAQFIAELVPDGATLQLGIGSIPDAVLHALVNHRDLGIHSEMFSDGVVDLVERGVITCKRKNINAGKIVAGFVIGTRRVYDFVDNNPFVELHPIDYVNDPFLIARHNNMMAINTCLEIDLTGQVCSDSIGTSFYSGIGGQVDFIRGAARSRGGKAILALPSTAMGGIASRIVPRLSDGAGVVTTRGDVHYVVTEYGIADLHGRTVRERAMALISIAHPKFRPWLLAEAKRLRFTYADQIEPPVRVPLYPRQLELRTTMRDERPLLIRPVRATDEDLLRDMFYRLSSETIYERFLASKRYLPHSRLQQFCTIDYDQMMGLLATTEVEGQERVVGWAMYVMDRATGFAEAAFLVDDAFQGQGIGTQLMRRLTEVAESRGVKGFTALVLGNNIRMLRVFEKCGYPVEATQREDTLSLKIKFEGAAHRDWSAVTRPSPTPMLM